MDFLRGRIADLGLRCGFRERQTVYLPGNVLNVAELERETAARAEVGLRSRFIGADELRALIGIEKPGAILSSGAGEVDPAALVTGLWRSALTRGVHIHAPTEVVDIDPGRAHVTLATTIRRKLDKLLPGIDTSPEFTWAGCFGASPTGLPAIGAIPGAPRCFAVLGSE